jgi:hypothetical protein
VRLRLAAVLICVPVALTTAVAIAATRDPICTMMLGPQGLYITVPSLPPVLARPSSEASRIHRAHPRWSVARVLREARRRGHPRARPEIVRVTACAQQRCVTWRRPDTGGFVLRAVPGFRVPVTVALLHRDGRRQVLHARVVMHPSRVNGPSCGTDWVAHVVVEGNRLAVQDD